MFHVLFKGLSLFGFIMLSAIFGDDILTFVVTVLFAAFDFWTVKNITGRLLVQLRWWSEIDELGLERWKFESDETTQADQAAAATGDEEAIKKLAKKSPSNATDSRVFWMFLYATPCVWGFFLFIEIISFKFFWAITSGICFTLSYTNA